MKTIEILSEMNIHFDEATDSLFDYILGCKKNYYFRYVSESYS